MQLVTVCDPLILFTNHRWMTIHSYGFTEMMSLSKENDFNPKLFPFSI